MENKAERSVLGSSDAPYLDHLANRCGDASDYHAISHPSLPNYLALTSGSTHGVTDDAAPSEHPLSGPSIFSEVAASGGTWATYAESMPAACDANSSGKYATKHNPALYYTGLAASCPSNDVPLGTVSSGALSTALAGDTLPSFSLVVPNLCNDTHDCDVEDGDHWLSQWMTAILDSPAYASGETAIFVTWDEDDKAHRNHVGLVAVAPSIRAGTVVTSPFTHLSLLRTTEELLGLQGTLVPTASPMRAAFGL